MVTLFAGIFFILPCIESYTKVDLRTVSFDVPPQEVSSILVEFIAFCICENFYILRFNSASEYRTVNVISACIT